ncbi:hypothetical protein [Fictibacillus barbaricus]|uniref:Uncharacterized protein n=1 Tax=Fictibacillus barbaricus TaxID=182136 RepID=A0ABU1TWC4_9BACL|nr:hypothetical protein [Fictibacillus barbaricus]MDR7071497.1 hypothetical protein [Fictibacillus barbaricus]
MNELKFRNMLRKTKSQDPEKRFEALDALFEYKETPDLEVRVDLLKEVVETAASSFPDPVDVWDQPSYYLTDFVCDYAMPEVVEHLIKYFDKLSPDAKVRALELFLITEDEEIFFEIEDKIATLIHEEEVILPVEQLCEYPVFVRNVVDQVLDKLNSPHYKYMMYDFILAINESGVEPGYKKQNVLSVLLKDYQDLRREYLSYDKDYQAKYVYTSWKEDYFKLRYNMNLLLQLTNYYFTNETEEFLKEATHFNDPVIAAKAVHICMEKNLDVDKAILSKLAADLESAEMIYWDLKSSNKEHLFPNQEDKQPLIAKSKLLTHIVYLRDEEDQMIGKFPEQINVLDSIETENQYGQPIRYFLMSFKESDTEYVGWVGGFSLEDGDDTAHVWEGTYTDFVELKSKSISEHKEEFFSKRAELSQKYHEEIHYKSSPKLPTGLWFFYAILITHWGKMLINGIDDEIYISIGFTVIGLLLTVYELWKKKRSQVVIVGQDVVVTKGKNSKAMKIQDIKKVKYNKKHVQIYNKQNDIQLLIPFKWVNYDHFSHVLFEHTQHLREVPFIEE